MNMQLGQCFARTKPLPTEKSQILLKLKKTSSLKKARFSVKIWLQKAKLATLCFDWFITWFTHLRGNKWNGTLSER